jgi:hypothetical protein
MGERMTDTTAAVRLTAKQRKAALAVLENRADFPDLEVMADAVALAVLTAEDDTSRRVVCVREPGGAFYVYGPYATTATAQKVIDGGLATRQGARGGVFPLIPAPKKTTAKKVRS